MTRWLVKRTWYTFENGRGMLASLVRQPETYDEYVHVDVKRRDFTRWAEVQTSTLPHGFRHFH